MQVMVAMVRQLCRVCRWPDGTPRQWISTEDAIETFGRCPYCGAPEVDTRPIREDS